jgi:choline dehydrogenase-like flavoprotein
VGLAHSGIHELRFRGLGGSTTRWAGQLLPLFESDFETRDWVALSGWPVSRAALDPFYVRAAELMGVPPFRGSDDWPAALAPAPQFDAARLFSYFSQFAPRPSFAELHGAALSASSCTDVILDANVVELVTDGPATHVVAARTRSLDAREVWVEARHFVLCTGGIEVPRLLLASDRHSDGGLGNSHDMVGRCFQDHPGFRVAPIAGSGSLLARQFGPVRCDGVKVHPYFAAQPSLLRAERLLNTSGGVVFEQAPAIAAGKQLYHAARGARPRGELLAALRTVARDPAPLARSAWRHFALRRPALDTTGAPTLVVGCEQAPNRASRVLLGDRRDELGMRRVALDWQLTEREIRTCLRMAELAAGELERLGLGSVALSSFELPEDPRALSGLVVDNGHHIGAARMAERPEHGVVDADCRVFGLENLWIGSCAVFPTGGFSNPTFTMLALCLRLADRLRTLLA